MIKLRTSLILVAATVGASACTSLLGSFDFEGKATGTGGTGGAATTHASSSATTGSGGTGGMATSTGPTSSSTGTGGTGGASECMKPADCKQSGTVCDVVSCTNHTCVRTPAPVTTPCADNGGKFCDDMGRCVSCLAAPDCGGTGNECTLWTCVLGGCVQANVMSGTPLKAQTAGDCKTAVCDGNGGTTTQPNSTDLPNDNETCTSDSCDATGTPRFTPVPQDTACTEASGRVCGDGANAGKCVECTAAGQVVECVSHICQANKCVVAGCNDGVMNGSETDKDCGGGCAPCADGKHCLVGMDCVSVHCDNSTAPPTCTPATCADSIKNEGETDIDCGGPICAGMQGKLCTDGRHCTVGSDCKSAFCNAAGACATPTCGDMALNGNETDVDCGGPTCDAMGALCPNGKKCAVNGDCKSNACLGGLCVVPNCGDGVKDGSETDKDCGGKAPDGCPGMPCGFGLGCSVNADCTTGFCVAGKCDAGGVGFTFSSSKLTYGIAADANYVYWTIDSGLFAAPSAPGNPVFGTVVTALNGGRDVVIGTDATAKEWGFFTTFGAPPPGALGGFLPTTTGGTNPVVSIVPNQAAPQNLTADKKYVYWTDTNGGQVMKYPFGGPSAVQVAMGQTLPAGIAVVPSGDLYWASGIPNTGNITKSSGGVTTVIVTGQDSPSRVVADTTYVYWITTGVPGVLRRARLDGSQVTDLIPGLVGPSGLALDSGFLYVTTTGNPGTVLRVSIAGGAAVTIAPNESAPQCVTVFGPYVYWGNADGSIRAAKK